VQQQRQTAWHRVEQVLARFAREIAELREQGWHEAWRPVLPNLPHYT
jgi:hypothetical protein